MAISELFKNNLFLQYLTGAGQDLLSGNPIGANVNAVTNQQITAQSMEKQKAAQQKRTLEILAAMLGKDPDAKATIDSKGVKMQFGRSMLGMGEDDLGGYGRLPEGFSDAQGAQSRLEGMTTPSTSAPTVSPAGGTPYNPFALGQLAPESSNPADLAGLTPEQLQAAWKSGEESGMLPFSIHQTLLENLRADEALDLDRMYKTAQIAELTKPEPLDQPMSALTYLGDNTMTMREFKALPTEEQEYMLYKEAAHRQGTEVMSRRDWQLMEPTEKIKTLTQISKDPKLLQIAKDLEKAGSTTISFAEKLGTTAAYEGLNVLSGEWLKGIEKRELPDPDMFALDYASPQEARAAAYDKMVTSINAEILSLGGTIENTKRDGNVVTWSVYFPKTGERKDIVYDATKLTTALPESLWQ